MAMRLVSCPVSEHAEAYMTRLPRTYAQAYRVEASAARIRCTVIVLTPVSAAIWRIDNPPFPYGQKTHAAFRW
jgi:hypothetical protein